MLHTLSFRALGGPCTLQLGGVGQAAASQAFDQARQELGRIERAYSRYRSDSIVSRLNAAAGGDWIECDAETQRLLDLLQHSGLNIGCWQWANVRDPG